MKMSTKISGFTNARSEHYA